VTRYDEERLGDLLSALPPAPEGWVRAAQGIPRTEQGVDEIVERAKADERFRRHVVEYPEAALEEADVVAHANVVEMLRRRLGK
jgi:hypothetical protein